MLAELELPPITGLTADSRQVRPGMLYAALPGARVDGRAFIAQAVARGAAAVLAPSGTTWPAGVPARPMALAAEPRATLARLAAAFAGPQPEAIVAITGTNGKTSTADFLRQLLTLAGRNAASLGTLGLLLPLPSGEDRGEGLPQAQTSLTTPDPIHLAQTLAALKRQGIEAVALEASSHGLAQHRLDGVTLAAAAFTNLTRDHLDYHRTLPAYRAAKLRLFADLLPEAAPAFASTALDAETLAELRAITARRRQPLHLVGAGGTRFDLLSAAPHPGGQTLHIAGHAPIDLPLPGRFQADNALLAAALAAALGVPAPLDFLPRLAGVRGRMELAAEPEGAAAYVDYAHTPDALERLLLALRPHTKGRLILVFGAGGDRDPGKRPLMGDVARRLSDHAIVTDDNPRSEDPAAIRAAIRAAHPDATDIGDRAEAIAHALALLRPGDVLAVAGKGHEAGQTIGQTTHPFDDAETIRRLAKKPSPLGRGLSEGLPPAPGPAHEDGTP